MKYAISNIALPPHSHTHELMRLGGLGFDGLEVAPSRVWSDTWQGLTTLQVEAYRKDVETAGLNVVGLHSLFFDHPELGLFESTEQRADALDFLVHLSAVCRDLGGRTLIYGGGRKRGAVPESEAFTIAADFMGALCQKIASHGTCFCFEPLGPTDTDFIHSAFDSLKLVTMVDHPALQIQLDAKALAANDEAVLNTFQGMKGHLVHYHANEPGFNVLGDSGKVDHMALGEFLREVGYAGYVSIEQRMLNESDPLSDIARSAVVVKECYP